MNMKEKEREAEHEFKEWLDKHNIAYWYIQQDIETFSPSLKQYMTKRPDFMILIPNLGFILIVFSDISSAINGGCLMITFHTRHCSWVGYFIRNYPINMYENKVS